MSKYKSKNIAKNGINKYFFKSIDKIYSDSILEQVEQQNSLNIEQKKSDDLSLIQSTVDIDTNNLLEANKILEKKCKDLESANAKLMKDNRALKKLLDASKSMNLFKDVKIKQLRSTESVCMTESSVDNRMLFKSHEAYFTAAEIKDLRSLGKGKRKDAAFITKCVDFLYKSDKTQILNKCSGDRKIKGKTPISPHKQESLAKMLQERVEADKTSDEDDFERCSRINRLMGDAIYNLTKRN